MSYVDAFRTAQVRRDLHDRGRATDLRRIDDLNHKENYHTWLWSLSPYRGPVLDPPDHIEAIRIRLGIAGPTEPTPCHLCGKDTIDSNASHALCCDKSKITRGHHHVARTIFDVAAACDPSTELEAADLIPGTKLRPALSLIHI